MRPRGKASRCARWYSSRRRTDRILLPAALLRTHSEQGPDTSRHNKNGPWGRTRQTSASRTTYLPREATAVPTIDLLGNQLQAALRRLRRAPHAPAHPGSTIRLRRRELIVSAGAAAILWPCATRAQKTALP